MLLPLSSVNLNVKSIKAYKNELKIKQHKINPINDKPTYTTWRFICKTVEPNLIHMHYYWDTKYGKLHLIKETSCFQGVLLNYKLIGMHHD